jgi:hypothetical protein
MESTGSSSSPWQLPHRGLTTAVAVIAAAALGLLVVQVGLPAFVAFPFFFPLLLGAAFLVFLADRMAGLILLLVFVLYQNLVISIFADAIPSRFEFQALQGTNFALIFAAGVASLTLVRMNDSGFDPGLRRLVMWVLLALGLMGVYTLYGVTQTSAVSALIYFRYTSTALLCLGIGLWVGLQHDLRVVARVFLIVGGFTLVVALLEIAFPNWYYRSVDAGLYHGFKSGREYRLDVSYIEAIVDKRFLNLPLDVDLRSRRFMSTIQHHVSYAYVMAVLSICAMYLRRYWPLALLGLLLIYNGSKGPILLAGFSGAFLLYSRYSLRGVVPALLTAAGAYVAAAIGYGLMIGDQHVIGFLSGLIHTLERPWGHGLGVGGNLSEAAEGGLEWDVWREGGSPFALESAVGVLIYQMGVASLVILGLYVAVTGRLLRGIQNGIRPRREIVFAVGVSVCVINAIFQEEAFSPYALGLLMLFAGVIFGNQQRRPVVNEEAPEGPSTPFPRGEPLVEGSG